MTTKERFKNMNTGRVMVVFVGLICIFLAAVVLKLMAPVLIPLTVAVILSLVFDPIVSGLQKIRIPRPVGIAVVVLIIGGLFYLLGLFLVFSARRLIELYPKYELRISEVYMNIAWLLQLPYDQDLSLATNLFGMLGFRQQVQHMAIMISNNSFYVLVKLGLVLFFMVYLMIERAHFKEKILAAFEGRISGKIRSITTAIVKQTVRYLSVKFLISLMTGLLAFGIFIFVGLDFPLVWATLVFALNFIPNIGSIVAGVAATVFALIQFWPEPSPILITGIGLLAVNQILGNIVEPKVVGDSLDLSPFIVLFSLAVWGWLWGLMGLLLAVPLTVVIKIVCENIPILEPVSVIMGSYRALRERREAERAAAEKAAKEFL